MADPLFEVALRTSADFEGTGVPGKPNRRLAIV
jgi:hypothetical protein